MILEMTESEYAEVTDQLVRARSSEERAAFFFARWTEPETLRVERIVCPAEDSYAEANWGYLELRDGLLADLIREAHVLGAALVEAHSHPFDTSDSSRFSPVDLKGLAEVAPHVVWRLPGRPYAALVFGRESFDSLYWRTRARTPGGSMPIQVGDRLLTPTGLSFARVGVMHGSI